MLYVAAASYIIQNEARFFYKQDKIDTDYQYNLHPDFKELNIPINQKINLHGLLLKNKNKKALILYFSGSDYISGQINKSQEFYFKLGYDVLIPEYRSSGKSTGKYQTEEDLYSDAKQWMKMANSLSDSLPIILVGQDFGCGLAAHVHTYNQSDLLILEEPYLAWNDIMLRKYFWWLPHTWFTNYRIHTGKFIRVSSKPIVLIHPSESKNILYKNSELLLEYIKPGDVLITLDGEEIDYESKEFLNKFAKIKLPQ